LLYDKINTMKFTKGTILSLLVCASTTIKSSEGFTVIKAPPGLLGKESLLDMVDSYLDNLTKPSYSTKGETEKQGPKTSYIYTYRKNGSTKNFKSGVSSGGSYLDNLAEPTSQGRVPNTSAYLGELKAPAPKPVISSNVVGSMMNSVSIASKVPRTIVASGNYLDNLSQQPVSFTRPSGGFIYKGPKGAGSSSKPGVSPGNYLDTLRGASPTYGGSSFYAPPPPARTIQEPVSSTRFDASQTNYPQSSSVSSSAAAPKRPGGYMYQKPQASPGPVELPRTTSPWPETSAASQAPPSEGYTQNYGGQVAPQQGNYIYKPPQPVKEQLQVPASSKTPVTSGDYLSAISGGASSQAKPAGYMYSPPGGYFDRRSSPPSTGAANPSVARPAEPIVSTSNSVAEIELEELAIKPLDQWTASEVTLVILWFLLFVEILVFAQHHSDWGVTSSLAWQTASTMVDLSK